MAGLVTGGRLDSYFLDDNSNVWGCGSKSFFSSPNEEASTFRKLVNLENIHSVDSGFTQALLLDQDGTAYICAKINQFRVPGSTTDPNVPCKIPNLPKIVSLSTSFDEHSLFLDEENYVWGYGLNSSGQLAFGNHGGKVDTPRKVQLSAPMKSISAGWKHSVFLDESGTPWTCGSNYSGELGLGDKICRKEAEKIENLPTIREIYSGCTHTMFLAEDGSVWGTGINIHSELGSKGNYVERPIQIEGLPPIQKVALGWNYSLFLDFAGGVWACGSNLDHQLGVESWRTLVTEATKVELPEMRSIAAGSKHSLFIDVENYLWTCGNNRSKQLGRDTEVSLPRNKTGVLSNKI